MEQEKKAGLGGEHYIPYEERKGNESIVYFTRDLSAEGLIRLYEKIKENLTGRVAVKLHTGEQHGPNIIPRPWVKELMEKEIPNAAIVETNTYYDGDRYTTEEHRKTLEVNGWTFAPVDIMDEEGTTMLPVKGGKWFTEMSVGSHETQYDSMLVLTHFKGHTMGGFGGSNKNIGIGCAYGRIGKATVDYFGRHIAFINVMRNMSVSCDCEGVNAQPVVTPNVGILASLDILAIDQASVDMVYAMKEEDHHDLVERMESRHGLRQLTYMKELGMGNDRYVLIDMDHGEKRIDAREAVAGVKPFGK